MSVPEEIDYPNATFTPLRDLITHVLHGGIRLGLVGIYDIPSPIFTRLQQAIP